MVLQNSRGAIIYAGGMEDRTISSHFSPDEEGTLLEYVMDSVWTVADELNVVFSKEPQLSVVEAIFPFGAKVLTTPKDESPMVAITEAFGSASSEHCLIVSERAPLLKPNVALALFESARGYDLCIPRWRDGRIEPLLAVYRRNVFLRLTAARKTPFSNDIRSELEGLIEQLFAVKYLSVEEELAELDPELDSFLEVKDEDSLNEARAKSSARTMKAKK
jgi:molybdopterin-guanine dinucleotide biosynthesis protein A